MGDTAELIAMLRASGLYISICIEAADALSSLVRERDEAREVLRDHHKWHAESGILGIPDGEGGWIEMDNGAEYADSRLCQRTEEALRDMPPEFVVPPRGGWAMGSNHWENWQLAYRQKRAAEARATAAEAERDEARVEAAQRRSDMEAMAKDWCEFCDDIGLDVDTHPAIADRVSAALAAEAKWDACFGPEAVSVGQKLAAAEADAARMREALERIARETITDHIGDVWASPAAITARAALVRARNALGGKDE